MKLSKSINFKFEKLYLDCIDADGNCFIVYQAKLDLLFINFYYSGLIFSDSQNRTIEKFSLKKYSNTLLSVDLCIDNPELQVLGFWQRTIDPLHLTLYEDSKNRELIWNCHHPKAISKIKYNGKYFEGLGYAETLYLPIKPWKLPIEELRWGRFISNDYSITWINWKGKYPINKVFCNGTLYNDTIFEKDKLSFDSGKFVLHFQETSTIREGKLSGLVAKMRWLKFRINKIFLNTIEIKYKSRTTLVSDSKLIANGWSLFEIVTWKK